MVYLVRSLYRIAGLLLAISIPLAAASAAPMATLNILPLMDGYYPTSENVFNDGTVVGWGVGGSTGIAWKWSLAGGPVTVPRITLGYDLSGDGQWIAGQSGNNPMRWSQATGVQLLGPSDVYGSARGISTDGSVIVGSAGDSAFRWTEATGLVDLGDLPGGSNSSFALDISSDGTVIVGAGNSAAGPEAFRWTETTGMQGLGDLSGGTYSSIARAVSTDGTVIVGTANSALGTEAFRWSGGTMQGLGVYDSTYTQASANTTNEDGSLIGGYVRNGSDYRAMIWDEQHGMRLLEEVLVDDYNLDLQDFTSLREVWGISPDGQYLTGIGATSSFYSTFLIYMPSLENSEVSNPAIPEPSSLIVWCTLAFCFTRLRRRKNA